MQNASTALRVPVRCEEVSLQRWSDSEEAGAERWMGHGVLYYMGVHGWGV